MHSALDKIKKGKMIMKTFNKKMKSAFTLLELLIVVVILATLTGLISPSFSRMEAKAVENAGDYNMAGVERYVNMFKSANGVFPSGWNTGFSTAASAGDSIGFVPQNFGSNAFSDGDVVAPATGIVAAGTGNEFLLNGTQFTWLIGEGFASLTTGAGAAAPLVTTVVVNATGWTSDATYNSAGTATVKNATALTFSGTTIAASIAATDIAIDAIAGNSGNAASFAFAVLLTPDVDWNTAYFTGGVTEDSLVELDTLPVSGDVVGSELPYYTCIFLANYSTDETDSGLGVELLGAVSPRGDVVNP